LVFIYQAAVEECNSKKSISPESVAAYKSQNLSTFAKSQKQICKVLEKVRLFLRKLEQTGCQASVYKVYLVSAVKAHMTFSVLHRINYV